VPVAATVNAAVCPAVTVWLVGCVVMAGATAAVLAEKLTAVTFAVLTLIF
jgi:hypothetical protein